MDKKYPKHIEQLENNRVERAYGQPRIEPEGLDEAKTYTDIYNIPHEAPKR
ncbi:MAG: hypothetical protein KHY77_08055 [Butyricicoccus pullicaecorum]|nr:hypothetical protein [Butyricicoccus pullicaecorum]